MINRRIVARGSGSGVVFRGFVALLATLAASPCPGIEMFTFFGDGSRIGLPSLEVPVEAYRGIPLRSDRIRARRTIGQSGGTAAPVPPAGTMINVIPEVVPHSSMPATAAPRPVSPGGKIRRQQTHAPPQHRPDPGPARPVPPVPPIRTLRELPPESLPSPGPVTGGPEA